MKKIGKLFFAAGMMSLAASLCMGLTAFAATESGTIEGGFTWEVDTTSHTLTITGEGILPDLYADYYDGKLWKEYEQDLHRAVLNGVSGTEGVFGLVTEIEEAEGNFAGFSWKAELDSGTITVTGQGEVPSAPWEWLFDRSKLEKQSMELLILSDQITGISSTGYHIRNMKVGTAFQNLEDLKAATESVEIPKANPYFASYEGCVYSKDMSKLLYCPFCIEKPIFYPNVKTIGAGAFDGEVGADNDIAYVVIPWGVTTIEDGAFSLMVRNSHDQYVVLPNTITSMTENALPGTVRGTGTIFIYQKNNQLVDNILKGKWDSYQTPMAKPVNSISQYYPNQTVTPAQNGWVKEGSVWYYYKNGVKQVDWQFVDNVWYYLGTDGVMQTGWITYNGSTYYLRPWGGMMANGWYLINGKWYYFQSWGGTAKSRWIYGLDKKWYYVDANGVMLTNTRTPDGYYVDANGVWMQ